MTVSQCQLDPITHSHVATTRSLAVSNPPVDDMLHVTLQPPAEVFEHGRTSREHNVLSDRENQINVRVSKTTISAVRHPYNPPCKALV